MGLFSRLFGPASPLAKSGGHHATSAAGSDRNAVWVYVRCKKCGEVVALRLRKSDEIQRDCDGVCTTPGAVFFVRKDVMGTKCFNRMDLLVEFDVNYRVVGHKVIGGELVTREDYAKLQGAQAGS
ncbi:MAG TPA: hypothetical protein GX506_10780 [Firmicutes bacterium]|nr:hypothetical protein [Bacillota bacterium]